MVDVLVEVHPLLNKPNVFMKEVIIVLRKCLFEDLGAIRAKSGNDGGRNLAVRNSPL
jgi:hypothetical protein